MDKAASVAGHGTTGAGAAPTLLLPRLDLCRVHGEEGVSSGLALLLAVTGRALPSAWHATIEQTLGQRRQAAVEGKDEQSLRHYAVALEALGLEDWHTRTACLHHTAALAPYRSLVGDWAVTLLALAGRVLADHGDAPYAAALLRHVATRLAAWRQSRVAASRLRDVGLVGRLDFYAHVADWLVNPLLQAAPMAQPSTSNVESRYLAEASELMKRHRFLVLGQVIKGYVDSHGLPNPATASDHALLDTATLLWTVQAALHEAGQADTAAAAQEAYKHWVGHVQHGTSGRLNLLRHVPDHLTAALATIGPGRLADMNMAVALTTAPASTSPTGATAPALDPGWALEVDTLRKSWAPLLTGLVPVEGMSTENQGPTPLMALARLVVSGASDAAARSAMEAAWHWSAADWAALDTATATVRAEAAAASAVPSPPSLLGRLVDRAKHVVAAAKGATPPSSLAAFMAAPQGLTFAQWREQHPPVERIIQQNLIPSDPDAFFAWWHVEELDGPNAMAELLLRYTPAQWDMLGLRRAHLDAWGINPQRLGGPPWFRQFPPPGAVTRRR